MYRFYGSLNFNYQLNKNINLFSQIGITVNQVREQTFIPRKGISNDTLGNAIADSRLGGQAKRFSSLFNETYINYGRAFGRIHNLQLRAGVRYIHNDSEQDFASGFNSPTDQFISVGTGVSTLRRTGGDIGKNNYINTYVSADYSLANKYFFSYNMAVDGSSKFGRGVNNALQLGGFSYAVMPSIGASWLISSENFMAPVKFFDLLKLRASYGLTGNDDIGNYTAKQLYVSQNLLGLQGLVRSNISKPPIAMGNQRKSKHRF